MSSGGQQQQQPTSGGSGAVAPKVGKQAMTSTTGDVLTKTTTGRKPPPFTAIKLRSDGKRKSASPKSSSASRRPQSTGGGVVGSGKGGAGGGVTVQSTPDKKMPLPRVKAAPDNQATAAAPTMAIQAKAEAPKPVCGGVTAQGKLEPIGASGARPVTNTSGTSAAKDMEPSVGATISTVQGQFDRIPQDPSDVFLVARGSTGITTAGPTTTGAASVGAPISSVKGRLDQAEPDSSLESIGFLQDNDKQLFGDLLKEQKQKQMIPQSKGPILSVKPGLPASSHDLRYVRYQKWIKSVLEADHAPPAAKSEKPSTFIPLVQVSLGPEPKWSWQGPNSVGFLMMHHRGHQPSFLPVHLRVGLLGLIVADGDLEAALGLKQIDPYQSVQQQAPPSLDLRLVLYEEHLVIHLRAIHYPMMVVHLDQGIDLQLPNHLPNQFPLDQAMPSLPLIDEEPSVVFSPVITPSVSSDQPDPYEGGQIIEVFGFPDYYY